ncbi:MAG: DNA-directed RNA polymerase subunit D [Nanoarchaeota archaeon]|nr:DNA-directed RNA polymerase subunit D [Nanoarchaeota archaeon]MBU1004404.1 DNA-directed RNA polymerase subunit D [Nanoarchaeota archaeon]MBU1946709.1 DNA-directed RNA polymerase subunit D [Nanoarchaeota archaeon]
MIELRLLEQDKETNKVSFVLVKSTPSFANILRRTIIEEVPVMAVEEVEFRKNNSILYDEMIAHRLGLLPLSTDLKSYNIPSECKCEGKGCARCQLKLTLKAKGPGIVYASEMHTRDASIKPVFPKMPIVKLLKNQVLELEATAVLGKGKEHVKWSPGHVYYKNKPSVEIDLKKCDGCGKCIEQCPTKTLEIKDNKVVVSKDHLMDCHLCNACIESCPKDAITVAGTDDFIFTLESWGQLDCKAILIEASKILNAKLDDFSEKLKEAKLS